MVGRSFAHHSVQDEHAVSFNSRKRVSVTAPGIVLRTHALLLFPYEAPYLVALRIMHLHITDFGGHNAFALLSDQKQEFQNRVVVNFRCALDARNRIAFEKERVAATSRLYRNGNQESAKIDVLKSAARIFRHNAGKGEPFPVEVSTQN